MDWGFGYQVCGSLDDELPFMDYTKGETMCKIFNSYGVANCGCFSPTMSPTPATSKAVSIRAGGFNVFLVTVMILIMGCCPFLGAWKV